jgi:hypothetical protein
VTTDAKIYLALLVVTCLVIVGLAALVWQLSTDLDRTKRRLCRLRTRVVARRTEYKRRGLELVVHRAACDQAAREMAALTRELKAATQPRRFEPTRAWKPFPAVPPADGCAIYQNTKEH